MFQPNSRIFYVQGTLKSGKIGLFDPRSGLYDEIYLYSKRYQWVQGSDGISIILWTSPNILSVFISGLFGISQILKFKDGLPPHGGLSGPPSGIQK